MHISIDTIAELFKTEAAQYGGKGTLECVVLNACSTETMGRKLRAIGIPHVVCWSSAVLDETASTFSMRFYSALDHQNPADGIDYPRAFSQAAACVESSIDVEYRKPAKAQAKGAVDFVCFLSKDGDHFPEKMKQNKAKKHVLLTHEPAEEEDEEEPIRNWRPPRGYNDYGALAGEHERAALTALGFGMKMRGKDIAVGHGMKTNGFLEADVFRMWGVNNYPAIWGSSGKAVEKAREIKTRGQVSTLHTCVRELEQALMHRQKDMQKHADKRRCAGACPTNLKCTACDRKRWNCPDCKLRNCANCVARQQHEHMEARVRECKEAIQKLL